jgi:hypothetical protein
MKRLSPILTCVFALAGISYGTYQLIRPTPHVLAANICCILPSDCGSDPNWRCYWPGGKVCSPGKQGFCNYY